MSAARSRARASKAILHNLIYTIDLVSLAYALVRKIDDFSREQRSDSGSEKTWQSMKSDYSQKAPERPLVRARLA